MFLFLVFRCFFFFSIVLVPRLLFSVSLSMLACLLGWVSFSHTRERERGAMSTFVVLGFGFVLLLLLLVANNKAPFLLLTKCFFSRRFLSRHTSLQVLPFHPFLPPSLLPPFSPRREGGKEGLKPTPGPATTPAPPPRYGHKTKHATDASPPSK